jgi:hypothetical protein
MSSEPELSAAAVAAHPTAILEAVAAGRGDAAARLVGLGFDVNARAGRGQSFVTGATALHAAASDNDVDVVVVRALVVLLEAVAGRPDPA